MNTTQNKTQCHLCNRLAWLVWFGKGYHHESDHLGQSTISFLRISVFAKVMTTNRVTIVQAYSWPVRKQQVMSEVPKCPNHILFHKYSEIFYFSKPILEDKNKILENSKFWREKIRRFLSQVQVAKYGTGRGYNARNIRNNFMKKGTLSLGCPKKPKSPNFGMSLTPVVFIG